jgi:predicted GTPase
MYIRRQLSQIYTFLNIFVICEHNENVKRTFSLIHCQGTKEAKIVSTESTDETLRVARQTFLNWGNMNNVKITFATEWNFSF